MWTRENTWTDTPSSQDFFCCQPLGLWSTHLSGNFLAGVLIHSCNFDHGLCGWIREKDSDVHWEPVRDPAGKTIRLTLVHISAGSYLRTPDPLIKDTVTQLCVYSIEKRECPAFIFLFFFLGELNLLASNQNYKQTSNLLKGQLISLKTAWCQYKTCRLTLRYKVICSAPFPSIKIISWDSSHHLVLGGFLDYVFL